MGIKRCPYCRALISDRDQYCKNCGTQLLFPEDEEIEEEIPGDKIQEDDREKEESQDFIEEKLEEELEEEVNDSKRTKPEDLFLTEKEKLLFSRDEEPETSEKEDLTSPKNEDYLVEKIKKEVLSEGKPKSEELPKPGPGVVTRIVEEIRRKEVQEEAVETLPEGHPGLVTRMVEELELEQKRAAAESYEVEMEEKEAPVPPTFESAELDKIGATTDLGRREVEDFFKVLEEKEKEHLKERLKASGKDSGETGEVPSWIREVKTASTELLSGSADTGEVKAQEKMETETDEIWLEEEETATEPTMGFPEKLTRNGLEPAEAEEETTGEVDMELEEEIEKEEEIESGSGEVFGERSEPAEAGPVIFRGGLQAEAARDLPSLGFKNFVKAKVFDLLFLVMFWLVSIWIAARSMQTTIFKLLGLASSGLLLYLLILTFFYFFLFYFFIGETLGDRLFREGEEKEEGL